MPFFPLHAVAKVGEDVSQGAFVDTPPVASRLDTPITGTAGPTSAGGLAPPTPTPVTRARAKAPYLASEHAEHVTDLGGLGLMGLSSLDELREGVTGKAGLSANQRDLMNLAGLGVMAAPSYAAAKHLQQRGADRKGLAGGGSKLTNYVNLAGLAALGLPVVDRIQARVRGKPEEGRFLTDRQSALMELAGYGGLASNVLRAKMTTRASDKLEHQGLNRQLAGYGLLAAPEAIHAIQGEHPEHPNYDAYGNPIPQRPGILRPITDLVGMAMLGQPVAQHLQHATKHAFLQGYLEEMNKLGEVDPVEFERSVARLEKLENDKPDPKQLGRYAAIGATLSPVASALEKAVGGDPILQRSPSGKVLKLKSLRSQVGRSVGGAIGAGLIPVVRHHLDRAAERESLRRQIAEIEMAPKAAEAAWRFKPITFGSPKQQLSRAQRVGKTVNDSDVPGPSPGALSKPKGFGKYIPGSKGV